jgi:hypothetical protein
METDKINFDFNAAASELSESFLNGNRGYVYGEIAALPGLYAARLALTIASHFNDTERNSFFRGLVNRT